MGFGLVIASILILTNMPVKNIPTKYEVETLARSYGMVYQDEILSFSQPAQQKEIIEDEPKAEANEEQPEKELETRVVVIPKGSSSEKIISILMENKVIEEPEAFAKKIQELGVANRLNAGEFQIPVGSSIDEIIDILVVGGRRR